MRPLNLLLWAGGIVLIAVGYVRARQPWQRYLALRAQQENADRYDAWRGRARGRAADRGPSSAEISMALFRRRAYIGAGLAIAGFVLIFAGFALR
jgi:hypothetical protein